MSKFLVILLFVGWSAGSTWYYTCEIKGLCEPTATQQVKPEKPQNSITEKIPELTSYIGFNKNGINSKKGPGWKAFQDSMLQIIASGDKNLLIVGKYFSEEKAPTGFRNMGLARAQAMKDELSKLSNSSNTGDITISSELMGNRPSGYWNTSMEFIAEKIDNTQAKVVESDNGLVIYFPSGSADAMISESLMNKLKRISKELVATNGGANIIGHTDNVGNRKSNHILGQKRAKMIERIFLDNGVQNQNLKASSMGDTQPDSDNSTAEGRALNRRIEITFNDNK
jgi:outer membrane protein OmpA-like peptidoglycan-associated protein